MKFTKPFKGATGGNPFPQDFNIGDECPDDLVQAAIEVDAVEITLTDEVPDGSVIEGSEAKSPDEAQEQAVPDAEKKPKGKKRK